MAALTCSIHGVLPGDLTGCPYCANTETLNKLAHDVRRERIATAVLVGLVQKRPSFPLGEFDLAKEALDDAKVAKAYALALIAELDQS